MYVDLDVADLDFLEMDLVVGVFALGVLNGGAAFDQYAPGDDLACEVSWHGAGELGDDGERHAGCGCCVELGFQFICE